MLGRRTLLWSTSSLERAQSWVRKNPLMNFWDLRCVFTEFERGIRMGPVDFVASLGGLFGLCLGFSIISFLEILYWILSTICRNIFVKIIWKFRWLNRNLPIFRKIEKLGFGKYIFVSLLTQRVVERMIGRLTVGKLATSVFHCWRGEEHTLPHITTHTLPHTNTHITTRTYTHHHKQQ